MEGTWIGYFKYDNLALQQAIGFEKTAFTINIKAWDGNHFSGTILDNELTGGTPGEGSIEGECNGNKIKFIKQMLQRSYVDIKSGAFLHLPQKHYPILYEGVKMKDGTYKGTWKFKQKFKLLWGIIPISMKLGKGTWQMTKV